MAALQFSYPLPFLGRGSGYPTTTVPQPAPPGQETLRGQPWSMPWGGRAAQKRRAPVAWPQWAWGQPPVNAGPLSFPACLGGVPVRVNQGAVQTVKSPVILS